MDKPYSPGLEGIIAGESSICEVDEETGNMTYWGYDLEELAERASFEEVIYLLLKGDLPNRQQLDVFSNELCKNRTIPTSLFDLYKTFPYKTDPMDILRTYVSIVGIHDPETCDTSPEGLKRKALRLTAQIPTMIASIYRLRGGMTIFEPKAGVSHVENFFAMLTGNLPDPLVEKAMNVSLILYAEHEFNASTFSARVTASTLSDFYSAMTSSIGTLKGSLHGGANERVMEMLLQIGEESKAEKWIRNALAKKQRIPGFGHRVYKNGDARSRVIERYCKALGEKTGQTKWYNMSKTIERVVKEEEGFFPNLDFYSASTYYMVGLPIPLYTPIFVMSRVVGWAAHIIEQQSNNRLIRPRSVYIGPSSKPFVSLEQR
jgi:citrate synthase